MTHGSLFAGIGGFDLGFERAGIETIWQVEIDPFCRKVLEKHWPHVQRFSDIKWCGQCRQFELPHVDIISGGFPCQDVSHAGRRIGIDGDRSGLWQEMFRVVCELRPAYVVVENVSGLLDRGAERVVGQLAGFGYDAEWACLSACAFGAPHARDRVFIVAYPTSKRPRQLRRPERSPQSQTHGYIHWAQDEPPCQRVVDGIPARMDRIRSLGNAVVPQIAEWIGRRILEAEERLK